MIWMPLGVQLCVWSQISAISFFCFSSSLECTKHKVWQHPHPFLCYHFQCYRLNIYICLSTYDEKRDSNFRGFHGLRRVFVRFLFISFQGRYTRLGVFLCIPIFGPHFFQYLWYPFLYCHHFWHESKNERTAGICYIDMCFFFERECIFRKGPTTGDACLVCTVCLCMLASDQESKWQEEEEATKRERNKATHFVLTSHAMLNTFTVKELRVPGVTMITV